MDQLRIPLRIRRGCRPGLPCSPTPLRSVSERLVASGDFVSPVLGIRESIGVIPGSISLSLAFSLRDLLPILLECQGVFFVVRGNSVNPRLFHYVRNRHRNEAVAVENLATMRLPKSPPPRVEVSEESRERTLGRAGRDPRLLHEEESARCGDDRERKAR